MIDDERERALMAAFHYALRSDIELAIELATASNAVANGERVPTPAGMSHARAERKRAQAAAEG